MNFIACFQESHSGEVSKANFFGLFIKNKLFFFPSERILLLSDDKIILSKKFDFLAKVIVFIKRGLPKKFLMKGTKPYKKRRLDLEKTLFFLKKN